MCKVICILIVAFALMFPQQASAAAFTMNIQLMHQEDGMACGELWYNQKLIWRLALLNDGAKPVYGSYNAATTFIAPDIINGCFVIKVQ